ncbi:MAG: type IV pilin N-terminal domain-containing protein [Thermoplasmata archaeon]|jgi:flagellin-like protein
MRDLEIRRRSWRSSRKRAVSPIIATILLVAITVVLSAVLYLLISGLTGGPTSTPIGGAFTASHPGSGLCAAGSGQTLGAAAITGGCKAGDFIYTLTIESSRIAFGNVLFEVRTLAGSAFTGGGASASFALLDPATHVVAISMTGPTIAMSAKWPGYGLTSTAPTYTDSTPLTNLYLIVIDAGSATPISGEGLAFVAIGIGSFSGATSPLALP